MTIKPTNFYMIVVLSQLSSNSAMTTNVEVLRGFVFTFLLDKSASIFSISLNNQFGLKIFKKYFRKKKTV